jgi:hypothetical protein
MKNRDIGLIIGAVYMISMWTIGQIFDWQFFKILCGVFGGAVVIIPIAMMVDYSPTFEALNETILAIKKQSRIGKVSLAILIISQVLYMLLTGAAILSLPGTILGWGLVSDYIYSPSPIARAIYYRAQVMLCFHLSFPFIAFIAGLAAWKYHSHSAFKKAIVIGVVPLLVAILYFLLLTWGPDVEYYSLQLSL